MNSSHREPDSDQRSYWRFTGPQRVDKALHGLEGLVAGIVSDDLVTLGEQAALRAWLVEHAEHKDHPIFGAVMCDVEYALSSPDALDLLIDACWKLRRGSYDHQQIVGYFDSTTNDLQRLHGFLSGLTADQELSLTEVACLQAWLDQSIHLADCWPYDQVKTSIQTALKDCRLDEREAANLLKLFAQFGSLSVLLRPSEAPETKATSTVIDVCDPSCNICFVGRTFVVTGRSSRPPRSRMKLAIEDRRGHFRDCISNETDYLVVCADRNKAWAYEGFGRKIEAAIARRRDGSGITIVHEDSVWSAIESG
jgi:hypothetical protein